MFAIGTGLRAIKHFTYTAPGDTHVHHVRKGRRAYVKTLDGADAVIDFGLFCMPIDTATLATHFAATKFGRAL